MKGREGIREGKLESQVGEFRGKGEVIVMGDMNARIGKLAGSNGEEVVNVNGRKMMKLVKRNCMWVANSSDRCEGKWTRVQGNRRSVIDYVIIDSRMKGKCRRVCVEEMKGGLYDSHTDHKLV